MCVSSVAAFTLQHKAEGNNWGREGLFRNLNIYCLALYEQVCGSLKYSASKAVFQITHDFLTSCLTFFQGCNNYLHFFYF